MNVKTNRKNDKIGYVLILITATGFSTLEIVGKLTADYLHPFQLTFLRFLLGGLVLLPFALREIKKRRLSLTAGDFGFFALAGVLNVVVSMSFLQMAVLYEKASVVALIVSTSFIFTIPFARILLKEKAGKNAALTIAAGLLGLFVILNPFAGIPSPLGTLLAFCAAVTFALYTVTIKKRVERYGGILLSSFSFIIGSLMLLGILLFLGIPVTTGINRQTVPYLLYLGIFVSGIGYWCYFEAIRRTGAVTASMVFLIKPALSPLLVLLILGEGLTFNTGAGMFLIVAGAFIKILSTREEPSGEPSGKLEEGTGHNR